MGDFKHLVIAKFKEGVVVEEILKGMEKLASDLEAVKSFEWYFLCFFFTLNSLFFSLFPPLICKGRRMLEGKYTQTEVRAGK